MVFLPPERKTHIMKLNPRQLAAAAAIAGFLSVGGISVAMAQEDPTTTDDGTTRTEGEAGCDHGAAEDSDDSGS
jgi:hypothetical protein